MTEGQVLGEGLTATSVTPTVPQTSPGNATGDDRATSGLDATALADATTAGFGESNAPQRPHSSLSLSVPPLPDTATLCLTHVTQTSV